MPSIPFCPPCVSHLEQPWVPLRALSLLALLACLPDTTVQAQPAAVPVLGEVVVSGSRSEQLSDELPLSLDVVNARTLSDQQSRDVREALRDLPNTSIKHPLPRTTVGGATSVGTGRDGNVGLNIRGLGGNRVLMLVDGIRVPRSYAFRTTTFDREYLSMELLKRIEVVRGPASALYGSDGMAGLVNFITHEPADFLTSNSPEAAPKAFGGRIATSWSGDDRGRALAATVAGVANESTQWLLSANARRSHALDNMGTRDSPDTNRTTPNPQQNQDNAILAKAVLRPSGIQRHVVTLEHVEKQADVNLLSSRAPLPLTGSASAIAGAVMDEGSSRTMERSRLTWEGRYTLGVDWADQVQTVLAVQHAKSRQLGTSVRNTLPLRVRDNSYSERTWQAGLKADKLVRTSGDWAHKLSYGFDHTHSDISNLYTGLAPLPPEVFPLKRFPDTRETTHALYLQAESVTDQWSITPGLRWDYFSLDVSSQAGFFPPAAQPGQSLSGSALSPKLGVLYRANAEWSLFGQYAAGFRAPDAAQINGYFENAAEHVTIIPNPQLKPEKSKGIELGVRGRLARLKLDAAVFANHYSNLIMDTVLIRGTGTVTDPRVFQTLNTERARITGVELKGVYDWGVLAGGRVSTPFSWGRAKGVNRTTGAPLNSIDPQQIHVGLQYDTAAWGMRADLRHYGAKKASDIDSAAAVKAPNTQFTLGQASTLDLSAQWRVRKDLRLNFAIHNLTNRKYWLWPDVYGLAAASTVNDAYTQPGRSFHAALVLDF